MGIFDKTFGSLFGDAAPKIATGPTPYQQTPDFVKKAFEQLFSRGTTLSNNLDPALQSAYNMGVGGPQAMGFMKGAQGAFGQAGNFLNQVSPQVGMSNGFLNAASGNIAQGTNPITADMIGSQASALMSPYTSNVIDSLRAQYGDLLNSQLSANNSNSTLAGAFGSNRAALENGQTRLASDRAFGENAGGLLNNAYQTAATQALSNLQSERDRFLSAAGLNLNQSTGALNGANAYTNAAQGATQLGGANLAGSSQNVSNFNNRINQLGAAGSIPQSQLGILQSLLQSFAPYSQGGANAQYQNPGLFNRVAGAAGSVLPFAL
jgi:hypothetical protein